MAKGRLVAAVVGLLIVVVAAPPARARVAFEPDSVPAGSWTVVKLRVPVHHDEEGAAQPGTADRHNVRVVLRVAGPFVPGWCASPPGWACQLTEETGSLPYYTWNRESGPFEQEDVFEVALRAPREPGRHRFPAHQRHSDDKVVAWDGRRPERPAPTLTVTTAEQAGEPEPPQR